MKFVDAEGRPVKHDPRSEIIDLSLEFLVHEGKAPVYWDLDSATPEDIVRMKKRMLTHEGYMGFDPSQGWQNTNVWRIMDAREWNGRRMANR